MVRYYSILLNITPLQTQWVSPSAQRDKTYFQPDNHMNCGPNLPAFCDYRYRPDILASLVLLLCTVSVKHFYLP